MTTTRNRSLVDVLLSPGPASDLADRMALYGWLVGSWEMDAVIHADDGSNYSGQGEILF